MPLAFGQLAMPVSAYDALPHAIGNVTAEPFSPGVGLLIGRMLHPSFRSTSVLTSSACSNTTERTSNRNRLNRFIYYILIVSNAATNIHIFFETES